MKNSLEHLALHKHVSAVLKIYANANTTVENANTENQPESLIQHRKTIVFIETASVTPHCKISS